MEKLVIFIAFALSAVICNAQEVIELEEAKIELSPVSDLPSSGNSFLVNIEESYIGEFEKDPLAFVINNFDFKEVIAEIGNDDYSLYQVRFITQKGELKVHFDQDGKKLGHSLRFKNMFVPVELMHQLYRDHKGWATVKTLHFAKEDGKYQKDFYKITLKKGDQTKKLKINASDIGRSTLVAFK